MIKTRSSNKVLLRLKRPYSEKFKHSLAYIGPKKWNALLERFHHTQSKAAYKSLIEGWVQCRAASAAVSASSGVDDTFSIVG